MAKNQKTTAAKTKSASATKPLSIPNGLTFALVEATIHYNEGVRVTISVESNPRNPNDDPEYIVNVDQSKLTQSERAAGYSMLTLGLQSGAERTLPGGAGKTGVIKVLEVFGSDVTLGRTKANANEVTWDKQPLKVGKTIPAFTKDEAISTNLDGEFIKCSDAFFGLRVYHVNGKQKRPTRWGSQVNRLSPNGTNFPPPIPPGSSIGD